MGERGRQGQSTDPSPTCRCGGRCLWPEPLMSEVKGRGDGRPAAAVNCPASSSSLKQHGEWGQTYSEAAVAAEYSDDDTAGTGSRQAFPARGLRPGSSTRAGGPPGSCSDSAELCSPRCAALPECAPASCLLWLCPSRRRSCLPLCGLF